MPFIDTSIVHCIGLHVIMSADTAGMKTFIQRPKCNVSGCINSLCTNVIDGWQEKAYRAM